MCWEKINLEGTCVDEVPNVRTFPDFIDKNYTMRIIMSSPLRTLPLTMCELLYVR